jgi:alpha,alpha-trehalose phosphorylase
MIDPTQVELTVDGVEVSPRTGTWSKHRRTLDLRTGCVATTGTWCGPAGAVEIRSRRLVSLEVPGLVWFEVEVLPTDGRVEVELAVAVQAYTGDQTFPDEPPALSRAWGRVFRPVDARLDGAVGGLVQVTALSRIVVACAAEVVSPGPPADVAIDGDRVERRFRASLASGDALTVAQRIGVADGRDAWAAAKSALSDCSEPTFDAALARQRAQLDGFWAAADVQLDGAPEAERAVRFQTFQVLQAGACNQERASPAKGLTGQGYEGHHLWDQEIYMGHVLSLLAPNAARAALAFRFHTLDTARVRAHELSYRGAQYPWRTIDGREASSFFPAGAAQFHVNADIAWAIDHYVLCTGDDDVLLDGAFEVLVETARFWACVGRYDDAGRFRIEGVTGPDEYSAIVNNNLYTNLMAAQNLTSAADRVDWLRHAHPEEWEARRAALELGDDEPATWRADADSVVVPYDEALGLHGQDDAFLELPRADVDAIPAERFPLQDHFHLLTLYGQQVCKQADLVLALHLVADRFTPDERRRDFEYYEAITTHDSSLSAPAHALVAAEVGHLDRAWRYACESAFTDLTDRHHTLDDGLHLGAAAGSWTAIASGFGGFGVRDGRPSFRPRLPPGVSRLRFALRHHGTLLEVVTDRTGTTYSVLEGDGLTLVHDGEPVEVQTDAPARAPAPPVS